MNHAVTVRAHQAQVLQFRTHTWLQVAQRYGVMTLNERLPTLAVYDREVKITYLTAELSAISENQVLLALDQTRISFTVVMRPSEDSPFFRFFFRNASVS